MQWEKKVKKIRFYFFQYPHSKYIFLNSEKKVGDYLRNNNNDNDARSVQRFYFSGSSSARFTRVPRHVRVPILLFFFFFLSYENVESLFPGDAPRILKRAFLFIFFFRGIFAEDYGRV